MKLGGRLRSAISGLAASFLAHLDSFFNTVGIPLLNAQPQDPVRPGDPLALLRDGTPSGAMATPLAITEPRIRRDDGREAGIGEKGILLRRGPQVMRGYYRNEAATAAVLDAEGWLDTGDLAVRWKTATTSWSAGGEGHHRARRRRERRAEPIEDKLKESTLIDYAVVLGQDDKSLADLLALNEEELARLAKEQNGAARGSSPRRRRVPLHRRRCSKRCAAKSTSSFPGRPGSNPSSASPHHPGARPVLDRQELTKTLKVKRRYVEERYRELIERIFPPKT